MGPREEGVDVRRGVLTSPKIARLRIAQLGGVLKIEQPRAGLRFRGDRRMGPREEGVDVRRGVLTSPKIARLEIALRCWSGLCRG